MGVPVRRITQMGLGAPSKAANEDNAEMRPPWHSCPPPAPSRYSEVVPRPRETVSMGAVHVYTPSSPFVVIELVD